MVRIAYYGCMNPFLEDLKSTRRDGFYVIDGVPHTSVTNILQATPKKALQYWFGKMVYEHMRDNPGCSQEEALRAPYAKSDVAKTRGTNVHAIVDYYLRYDKDLVKFENHVEQLPEELIGYGRGFIQWLKDWNPEIEVNEKTVCCTEHKYAGTLDMIVKTPANGRKLVTDIKTGKDIYDEAYLQMSAYRYALEEKDYPVDGIAVLLLSPKGKYRFEEGEYDFQTFLAVKQVWLWQLKNQNPKLYKSYMEGNSNNIGQTEEN